MAVLAIVLGWLMAGRVLRPLRTMAAATQQITERNLHERLALPGPGDEIKHLADTIDGLLARLETPSRPSVTSSPTPPTSCGLRSPSTGPSSKSPSPTPTRPPRTSVPRLEELLASGEQQERLIEALLTLANSERGLDRREQVDLGTVAARALPTLRPEIAPLDLQVTSSLETTLVTGNAALVERMVANLIENAIRYNVPGGSIDVRTECHDGSAVLTVANSGRSVPDTTSNGCSSRSSDSAMTVRPTLVATDSGSPSSVRSSPPMTPA